MLRQLLIWCSTAFPRDRGCCPSFPSPFFSWGRRCCSSSSSSSCSQHCDARQIQAWMFAVMELDRDLAVWANSNQYSDLAWTPSHLLKNIFRPSVSWPLSRSTLLLLPWHLI